MLARTLGLSRTPRSKARQRALPVFETSERADSTDRAGAVFLPRRAERRQRRLKQPLSATY